MIPRPLIISSGIEHFLLKNQNQTPIANRANHRGQNGQFRT